MLLYLFFILIVTTVSIGVILWAGTFFFQGYIYTEPSAGIAWQAPAAAAMLGLGYTIWCLSIAFSAKATPQNIPYDSIFRFTPKEEMQELQGSPAPKIWAIKRSRKKGEETKESEAVLYVRKSGVKPRFHYEDTSIKPRPWQPEGVIAIEMEKPDGAKMRFERIPTAEGGYPEFVSSEGWIMREYEDGPTGLPIKFRFGRMLINLFFNIGHFVAWFLALWVVLRFQWTHALGLAMVMWLAFTLVLLPMILGYSGLVAANRQAPTALLWHAMMVC